MNRRSADFWEAVIAFVVGGIIIVAGLLLSVTVKDAPNQERTDHAPND